MPERSRRSWWLEGLGLLAIASLALWAAYRFPPPPGF